MSGCLDDALEIFEEKMEALEIREKLEEEDEDFQIPKVNDSAINLA